MPTFWANGISGTTHNQSYFIDPDWYESRCVTPNIQPAWDGQQVGLLDSCRPSVGGKFGAVQTRSWVSNLDGSDWRGTNLIGVGAGNAWFQGWSNLTSRKGFYGGSEIRYGVDQLWGTMVIGRSAVGGRNILSGNPGGLGWNGYAIGMEIGYLTLPSAPGTPWVSSPGVGLMDASWSAPGWLGETPITHYYFDYALNPSFVGFTRFDMGGATSISLSGLTGGSVYYTRVMASNAVGDAWGTHGPVSGVSVTTITGTPPAPPDPIPVVKISVGGAWVPINRLNVSEVSWRASDLKISNGTVWQSPIA